MYQSTHFHLHSRQPAEAVCADCIDFLAGRKESSPFLVAIGGPGGSGKTTFAEKLKSRLADSSIVHLDNYKTSRSDRRKKQLSGPHPDANQTQLVIEHLSAVKSGKQISLPHYDLESGDTGSWSDFIPTRIIIVEGEISTYREFRHFMNLSIFIDSDFRTQLNARIGRDREVRGHSLEKAIRTFLKSNLTEFTLYGADSKQWADIHLFCHEDYHFSLESVHNRLAEPLIHLLDDVTAIHPSGCIVPVATPFEKNLSLCHTAFINHLSWLSEQGITRIIVGGTTAEFFSLTFSERLTLLKLAREYFPGYIIFNISANDVSTVSELAKRASQYGTDALICLPPSYYAAAPEHGLTTWFSAVSGTCELPLFLYNFPKHTGNPLTSQMLSEIPHAGVKDSSGDLALIDATPVYLLGGDTQIVEMHKKGGCGFVPGLPNVFPRTYIEIEMLLERKKYEDVGRLLSEISSFRSGLPKVSGIVIIKKILNKILEDYPAVVRPPLDMAAAGSFEIPDESTTTARCRGPLYKIPQGLRTCSFKGR
jgi:4-hydroxy-tetrahydrodipicolinate synthase